MHKDIITVEGKLTPLSSKTHITYQFHLDYPLSSLEIDFRYAPKQFLDREASQPLILEAIEIYSDPAWVALHKKQWDNFYPLQNLLTLSLDSPLGFRGSAHLRCSRAEAHDLPGWEQDFSRVHLRGHSLRSMEDNDQRALCCYTRLPL